MYTFCVKKQICLSIYSLSIYLSACLSVCLSIYLSTIFPIFKFKLLGGVQMPVPTQKSTFDNACPKIWHLSICASTESSSFISGLNMLLNTCWISTIDLELPTILGLAWTWELWLNKYMTMNKNNCYSFSVV